MKQFKQDFLRILDKFVDGEHFAFIRFSDGELFVLQNLRLELSENGTFIDNVLAGPTYTKEDYKFFDPEIHGFFRDKLEASFKHRQENYFVGLSCPCCVGIPNFKWMKSLRARDDDSLTWANLFVNSNYPLFIDEFVPHLLDTKNVLICNENADLSKTQIPIVKEFRIGRNAMIRDFDLSERIDKWMTENEIKNHVFLFSASSLTNITVYDLFRKHPQNTYIDIGTTLNPLFGLPITRDYLRAYWAKNSHPDLWKTCIWI